jgi:hypothetical protein
MATAPPSTPRTRPARRSAPPSRWRRWLLLGLLFGLGYGLTQRLLEVRWGGDATKAPAFKPKSSPAGTSLQEMRGEKSDNAKPLPADLDALAREQREEKAKQEALQGKQKEQDNATNAAERERLESDRRRLEELNRPQEPPPPEPTPQPVAPELPPPAAVPSEPSPPAAIQSPAEPPATPP